MVKIYTLLDQEGMTHYVGSTRKPLKRRLWEHINEARRGNRSRRLDWIRDCLLKEYVPTIRLVEEVEDNSAAESEKYWIKFLQEAGCDLVNGNAGGGSTFDAMVRERMARSMVRRWDKIKNRNWSEIGKCLDQG